MKLSEKLLLVANWLESSENDLLVNAEGDEDCLNIVADSLVKASEMIRKGSQEISKIEPEESVITSEKLDELAAVATAFDESGDELLMKQASVLDEILLTFAAPKNSIAAAKQREDDRIEQLKKKYKDTKVKQDEMNKVSDSVKDIEKSPSYKKYRVLEAPLSQRTCPDHPGAQLARVGEHRWQCCMDHKLYDYDTGFTTMDGRKVPGGDVSEQTKIMQHENSHTVFDTRNERLGQE
jgi:hypothetical protein